MQEAKASSPSVSSVSAVEARMVGARAPVRQARRQRKEGGNDISVNGDFAAPSPRRALGLLGGHKMHYACMLTGSPLTINGCVLHFRLAGGEKSCKACRLRSDLRWLLIGSSGFV